ncbi:MAG TPA: GNAT family N-acetyltransferase [Gaiellaceae bacterium]
MPTNTTTGARGSRRGGAHDIHVDEASQGQGIGRLAVQLLEHEVSARELTSIELNVFGGNTIARSLYSLRQRRFPA